MEKLKIVDFLAKHSSLYIYVDNDVTDKLEFFLASIQIYTMFTSVSFFQKFIKGGWNKSWGVENFAEINKRGGGTIIRYLRVVNIAQE